jgi:SNF2 family DNA or RNA helicase
MKEMEVNVVVDVKVSYGLDQLVFVPRDRSFDRILKRKLSRLLPNKFIKQKPEGIVIGSEHIGQFDLTLEGIDLKWGELPKLFYENRVNVFNGIGTVKKQIEEIKSGGKRIASELLTDIKGLEVLDDHQWVNVACMTLPDSPGVCVFDEQGAGKTVTLIFAFDTLVERNQSDFALIVAPKSMVSEWPVDFEKFMHDRYKVRTLIGNNEEKRKILSFKSDVIVTNFETAISMEDELRALLRRYNGRATLVIDEAFFVKNADAQRTQAIKRLREFCNRAFVLCGTPAPNSPFDLIEQFNIVDFGTTFSGIDLPESKEEASIVINKAIAERGTFIRHLKVDVLKDLPPKKFHRVAIDLQPKQSEMYQNIARGLIAELNDIDDKEFQRKKMSFFAKRSALLQICSNPISVKEGYDETPAKLLALDQILKELIEDKNEKVVLWSFYTASLNSIVNRYTKYNPVRYDGKVTETADRREAVRLFKEDDNTMLFVGNPAAAGAGLNLQRSKFAVYESLSDQAAHYLQSLDRIHRRGQTQEVQYLMLLCNNTIEHSQYNRLIEKEKMAQKMLGDPSAFTMTREVMLSELSF